MDYPQIKRDANTVEHVPAANVSIEEILELLETQGYRCALSGRALAPDFAALDHVMPVSRGGAHEIENAQVLDKTVNRAKHTLTNDEFIQLCREVVAYADARQAV